MIASRSSSVSTGQSVSASRRRPICSICVARSLRTSAYRVPARVSAPWVIERTSANRSWNRSELSASLSVSRSESVRMHLASSGYSMSVVARAVWSCLTRRILVSASSSNALSKARAQRTSSANVDSLVPRMAPASVASPLSALVRLRLKANGPLLARQHQQTQAIGERADRL